MLTRVAGRRIIGRLAANHHYKGQLLSMPTLRFQVQARHFSNNDELKETLRKVKEEAEAKAKESEGGDSGEPKASPETESGSAQPQGPSMFAKGLDFAKRGIEIFVDNVKLAYEELTASEKDSIVKKKIGDVYEKPKPKEGDEAEEDEEPKEAGPSAIVLVKEAKNPWEAMRERLADSPIIREMLRRGQKVGKAAVETDLGKRVQNAGQSVKEKLEDAREFWETSQNPIIYSLSGAWETVTGDTEESLAIASIKRLDAGFDKEEFLAEVSNNLVPTIIKAHLGGDTKLLKEWCSEAVYSKLSADIRTRKHDGLVFNDNILNVEEAQHQLKISEQDNVPFIVCTYQVQQINCIKKRGEIIEVSAAIMRQSCYESYDFNVFLFISKVDLLPTCIVCMDEIFDDDCYDCACMSS